MRFPVLAPVVGCLVLLAPAAPARVGAEPPEAGRALGDLGKVGTVDSPTSCDPALQEEFERGMALLHSFFYGEARRVFEDQ